MGKFGRITLTRSQRPSGSDPTTFGFTARRSKSRASGLTQDRNLVATKSKLIALALQRLRRPASALRARTSDLNEDAAAVETKPRHGLASAVLVGELSRRLPVVRGAQENSTWEQQASAHPVRLLLLVRDGLITEGWFAEDILGMLNQIGALPASR